MGLLGEGVGHDVGGLVEGQPCLAQRGVGGGMDQTGHHFADRLVIEAGQSYGVQRLQHTTDVGLGLREHGNVGDPGTKEREPSAARGTPARYGVHPPGGAGTAMRWGIP